MKEELKYLACEKQWVYFILMMSAGYLGGYTYCVHGGVFCNAQTGNMIKLAMAVGQGDFHGGFYYLVPFLAYLCGTVISEWLPERINRLGILRWDTILISLEIIVFILLGFMPTSWPDQVAQIPVNLICSMQYNTFRQAQHVPMATTFCSNHVRQIGINFANWIDTKDIAKLKRIRIHASMLGVFVVGCCASTFLSRFLDEKTIWGAAILLFTIWITLFRADRTSEKGMMDRKPAGH